MIYFANLWNDTLIAFKSHKERESYVSNFHTWDIELYEYTEEELKRDDNLLYERRAVEMM